MVCKYPEIDIMAGGLPKLDRAGPFAVDSGRILRQNPVPT
jgi:hypothetical protein